MFTVYDILKACWESLVTCSLGFGFLLWRNFSKVFSQNCPSSWRRKMALPPLLPALPSPPPEVIQGFPALPLRLSGPNPRPSRLLEKYQPPAMTKHPQNLLVIMWHVTRWCSRVGCWENSIGIGDIRFTTFSLLRLKSSDCDVADHVFLVTCFQYSHHNGCCPFRPFHRADRRGRMWFGSWWPGRRLR